MTITEGMFLGLVQGLTEFLPISSSGHLTIIGYYMNIDGTMLLSEVLLHLGTLLAVVIYFRKTIARILKTPPMLFAIGISLVPTAIAGLLIKKFLSSSFTSPLFVSVTLTCTSLMLFATKWASRGESEITPVRAFFIGIAQGLAVLPGLSRSGFTIAASLFMKIPAKTAAEFSFLISIPAIMGASLLELNEAFGNPALHFEPLHIIPGILVASVTGYISLIFLMKILARGKLFYFSFYLFFVGIFSLLQELYR